MTQSSAITVRPDPARDPRAAQENNVAGLDACIVQTAAGPRVATMIISVFGAPRQLALLDAREAQEYGRQLMALGQSIEGR